MRSELERLARVAVGHGPQDPALDVFLIFVGSLDPLPNAATLRPAAQRIGKLRLAQALDRPGEPRLGACRLLAAASVAQPRAQPAAESAGREDDRPYGGGGVRAVRVAGTGTVTVEGPPVGTGRRIPDLFDALLHAIRVTVSLLR
jgi:hypothetical protein